jgi:phosphoribosylformylglycinamidine synthase
MALAGGIGAALDAPTTPLPAHALWFGEDQARYVVATSSDQVDAIHKAAATAKVPLRVLGRVGGDAILLDGEAPLPLAALKVTHEGWLPRFMAHG